MSQPAPAPALAARPPVNKWLVTISVTFGTLMGAIDVSIVNVAIPHLRGAVGATVEEITWVTTGFALAQIIVMPLTGFLGRLFGQKRLYMFCLGLFVFGSIMCGLARSLTTLVLFRAIQGAGAGALQPTEQAILRQTFPPEEQGMAMAVFGMAVMIGPALGPTLGGYIVDNYSWPWIFYINVPVGILALFMVSRFVIEPEDVRVANRTAAEAQRKHMDWAGIILLSMGLCAVQYVLEEGSRNDWFEDTTITLCALTAVISLSFFVVRELTAKVPAVNLSLFKDSVFTSGTLIGGVMFAMLMANTFLLPLFMQELLGFDAMQSGMALMPRSLIMMVATMFVGRVYNKVSPRLFIAAGVLLFVFSAWQMSHYTLATGTSNVVAALLVQGVAFSFLFVPLTTVALSSIERHKLADATGLNSLIRQIGGSIGLAIFATLLSRYTTVARAGLVSHLVPGRPELTQRMSLMNGAMMRGGSDGATAHQQSLAMLNGLVTGQASVLAFEKLFLLAGILFLTILPLLLFLKSPAKNRVGEKIDVHVEM